MKKMVLDLWLSKIKGLGPRGKWKLWQEYGIEVLFDISGKEMLSKMKASDCRLYHVSAKKFIEKWDASKKDIHMLEEYIEKLRQRRVNLLTPSTAEFPKKLENLVDCPLTLYAKGKPIFDRPTMAIVGTRRSTEYGNRVARYFAEELSKKGFNIVSGLAYGIDVQAHMGALDAGGMTTAVMAGGLKYCYPKANAKIYKDIENHGCLLSEEDYQTKPQSYMFPKRNRIISGLANGVLVIEAACKSGSLITADCALEQGKDVYAVPGRIFDDYSRGVNHLVRQGAKPVFEVDDILEDYPEIGPGKVEKTEKKEKGLEEKEKIVYSCISYDPIHIEEIYGELQKETIVSNKSTIWTEALKDLQLILLTLELKGLIVKKTECYYARLEV